MQDTFVLTRDLSCQHPMQLLPDDTDELITYQQMKGESHVKLGKIVKSTPCKVMVDLPNCMFQFKKDEPEQGKNGP